MPFVGVETRRVRDALKQPVAFGPDLFVMLVIGAVIGGTQMLVCVGPSPTTSRLLHTAKRMSAAFGCEWLAVAVTTPQSAVAVRAKQIAEHLRLAERLGAETHTLVGDNVSVTVLDFAQSRNGTKVVVGKTAQPWWWRLLARSIVDRSGHPVRQGQCRFMASRPPV